VIERFDEVLMARYQQISSLLSDAGNSWISRREFVRELIALGVVPSAVGATQPSRAQGTNAPSSAMVIGDNGSEPRFRPPWEGSVHGGPGRVAFANNQVTFDPPVSYDDAGYYGTANFARDLTYLRQNADLHLGLAESISVSDDAKRYVFQLRRGLMDSNVQ